MKHYIFFIFASGIALPAHSADEYIFDLNRPPLDTKAQFAYALRNLAAQESGVVPPYQESPCFFNGFRDALAIRSNTSAERWAAIRYAEQQTALSYLPDLKRMNAWKSSLKNPDDIREAFRPWTTDYRAHSVGNTVGHWMLNPPALPPKTSPEEVKKLNRYTARLAAQMHRRLMAMYDSEYKKKYPFPDWPIDIERFAIYDPVKRSYGQAKRTPAEEVKFQAELRDYEWADQMQRTHEALLSAFCTLRSDMASLFRAYLPGDKVAIREMLIEAGYDTAAKRREYWQFCRTTGASWASWTSEDEQRLVTD